MVVQISVTVVVRVVRDGAELSRHFRELHHGFDNEDLYDGGDDGVDDTQDPVDQKSEDLSGSDIGHGAHPETPDISCTENKHHN